MFAVSFKSERSSATNNLSLSASIQSVLRLCIQILAPIKLRKIKKRFVGIGCCYGRGLYVVRHTLASEKTSPEIVTNSAVVVW